MSQADQFTQLPLQQSIHCPAQKSDDDEDQRQSSLRLDMGCTVITT